MVAAGSDDLLVEGRPWRALAAELGVSGEANGREDSEAVIDHLTKAYEHFKKAGYSARMILFLALQMAQEYLYVQNYDMAKRFFERILPSYQKEQWWSVLAQIQRSLRECAVHLKLLPEFVTSSVALLSKHLSDEKGAATALQQLLALVRLADATDSPAALPFPPLSAPMDLTIDSGQGLIRCIAEFAPSHLPLGSKAKLRLSLTSLLAVPLAATALQVTTSDANISRTLLSPDGLGPQQQGSFAPVPLEVPAGGELGLEIEFEPMVKGVITLQQAASHPSAPHPRPPAA